MSELEQFDRYLKDDGPAALVLRDELVSVEGSDGVLFPPTFAAGDGFPGGYNIDGDPNGENVCLIDSVGSQANRIEPMFEREPYSALVPQIGVRVGERVVSLLEAGHRAGDAIVRCSPLQDALQSAFKAVLGGDATGLARVAPTSLVFGVWDSRGTQAKLPRLIASTIRAFNVRRLTRSAQFVPATDYVADKLLDEPSDRATKDAYSERGFTHVPATGAPGGVIAKGGVRREAVLGVAALRLLRAGTDADKTLALQRYTLGLALTAFTANASPYLRQGCTLVLDASKAPARSVEEVYSNGERKPFAVSHAEALAYARATATAFGVGESRVVSFDKERAKIDLAGDEKKEKKEKERAKGKKAKASQ